MGERMGSRQKNNEKGKYEMGISWMVYKLCIFFIISIRTLTTMLFPAC